MKYYWVEFDDVIFIEYSTRLSDMNLFIGGFQDLENLESFILPLLF